MQWLKEICSLRGSNDIECNHRSPLHQQQRADKHRRLSALFGFATENSAKMSEIRRLNRKFEDGAESLKGIPTTPLQTHYMIQQQKL